MMVTPDTGPPPLCPWVVQPSNARYRPVCAMCAYVRCKASQYVRCKASCLPRTHHSSVYKFRYKELQQVWTSPTRHPPQHPLLVMHAPVVWSFTRFSHPDMPTDSHMQVSRSRYAHTGFHIQIRPQILTCRFPDPDTDTPPIAGHTVSHSDLVYRVQIQHIFAHTDFRMRILTRTDSHTLDRISSPSPCLSVQNCTFLSPMPLSPLSVQNRTFFTPSPCPCLWVQTHTLSSSSPCPHCRYRIALS